MRVPVIEWGSDSRGGPWRGLLLPNNILAMGTLTWDDVVPFSFNVDDCAIKPSAYQVVGSVELTDREAATLRAHYDTIAPTAEALKNIWFRNLQSLGGELPTPAPQPRDADPDLLF